MKSFERARTRCMSEEVQYYHKEMYTFNTDEELRKKERGRKRVSLNC
jgi:hypothetical protein